MKIVAGSDFHYPRRLQTLETVERMAASDADVLVLAGDLVDTFDPVRLLELLEAARAFPGPKVYVWGNHELWSRQTSAEKIHHEALPALAREAGFHCPEIDGPVWIGSVALVGVMGWYDYGFACQRNPPAGDLVAVRVGGGKLSLERTGRSLTDLGPADYARKRLAWYEEDRLRTARWGDGRRIRWDREDAEILETACAGLRQQLEAVHEQAEAVVAVTHMVPAADGLHPADNMWRAWIRAYMGSPRLGGLLREYPKARTWLFGHCHRGRSFTTDGIAAYNVASPAGTPSVIEVATP